MSEPATIEPPAAESKPSTWPTLADAFKDANVDFGKGAAEPASPAAKPEPKKPETPAKEPTAETAKPEAEPFTIDDLTEGLEDEIGELEGDEVPPEVEAQGEKATARWKELKAAEKDAKSLRRENEKLAEKLAASERKASASKEVEELRKRVAEQDKALAVQNVKETQRYRDEVAKPFAAIDKRIGQIARDEKHAGEIVVALSVVDPRSRAEKITDAGEDLTDYERTKLFAMADELDHIYEREADILAHAKETAAEWRQSQLAQENKMTEERREAIRSINRKMAARLSDKIPALRDQDGELLPEVKQVFAQAQDLDLLDPATPDTTRSLAAHATGLLTVMASQAASDRARIAELEATVASYNQSGPGGGSPPAAGRVPDGKTGGFMDFLQGELGAGRLKLGGR